MPELFFCVIRPESLCLAGGRQIFAGQRSGRQTMYGVFRIQITRRNGMKKGEIYQGTIDRVLFPNRGEVKLPEGRVIVKNGIPGQRGAFCNQ